MRFAALWWMLILYPQDINFAVDKAIAELIRLRSEIQRKRKREFFDKLRQNLADNDPAHQKQLVDEFRTLIIGR